MPKVTISKWLTRISLSEKARAASIALSNAGPRMLLLASTARTTPSLARRLEFTGVTEQAQRRRPRSLEGRDVRRRSSGSVTTSDRLGKATSRSIDTDRPAMALPGSVSLSADAIRQTKERGHPSPHRRPPVATAKVGSPKRPECSDTP